MILIDNFDLEGILNVLLGFSLFTLVFICIMEACDFCLSCSGLMGDKFFSLSLMLFGGRIGDLCKGCFLGFSFLNFTLLEVVCIGVVDPTCFHLDYNIGSLPITNPLLSRCLIKFLQE